MRLVLRRLRERGYNLRHVVIVGAGNLGRDVAARLRAAPWAGFSIHGFYDDDPALVDTYPAGLPVLGSTDRLMADLEEGLIDQVWIALPLRAEQRIRSLMAGLQQTSVQVRFVPDIFNFNLLHHSVSEIEGLPVINVTDSPLDGTGLLAKRTEDLVLALLLSVLALPVMGLIAIGVKLSSPGPCSTGRSASPGTASASGCSSSARCPSGPRRGRGRSGRPRTSNGPPRSAPSCAVTRSTSCRSCSTCCAGRCRSSVRARSARSSSHRFKRDIPGYMQKHLVKAGITGWAQVNDLRGDTDLAQRIQFDLYYIEHWSVWFDLRIIGLTLLHIVRSKHAY